MSKPILVFQAPIASRSGYGDHARSILKSIYDLDRFDVKVVPTNWGNTPMSQLISGRPFDDRVIKDTITKLSSKPKIHIQMTVPNEFSPFGEFNIGITAGTETDTPPENFTDGINKMDLVLVPSEFTKTTLLNSVKPITTPIDVIFEGVDVDIFNGIYKSTGILDEIKTEWNYLTVGHWLEGKIGEDRKDIGSTISMFCKSFINVRKESQPGLILKISSAGFSIGARQDLVRKIEQITQQIKGDVPPIYLLFGDLSEMEMNELYNHPKVKSMVSFTKGEGYGRPLAEFTTTGKPIIVSDWSGHLDFLPKNNTELLAGKLTPVDTSASNQFIPIGSKWFTVDYDLAIRKLRNVHKNYDKSLGRSIGLKSNTLTNFTQENQTELLGEILNKYVKVPVHVPMALSTNIKI